MMHTEFDSHWLGSNGNYESSHNLTNYANMRRLPQNNNNPKVVQENIQGFSRYDQFPRPANIYSAPTINTANSHGGTVNPQYSAQGPHQIPQQWQTYYQNSNSFGSSFTGEAPRQEPVQIQNTQVPYFKPTQSWSNNQNVMQYRNQNVNYYQLYVSSDNHKTSDCSNRTPVNESYISKTPRIRVRDVHSVNNTVCHGVHTNLHEPQRKEQTNHYANYMPSQRNPENSVMQTSYANVVVSGYKNVNNKGQEYYEVLPDNQSVPVSINNLQQQNMVKRMAWVPKLGLPINRNKNELLIAGGPGPRKASVNIGKPVCPQYAENALMGSKRIKISPRRLQSGPGAGTNVNTQSFLEAQSNQLNSGFQRPAPNLSLSSAFGSSNNAVYSISNMQTSRQNLVQRNQPEDITRTGCNSSIPTPCIVSSTLSTDNQYVFTISSAGSNVASFSSSCIKNQKSIVDGSNENSITAKARAQARASSGLNDTYIPSGVFYGVTSAHKIVPEVGRIPEEPSLIMTKENENKALPGCSESGSKSPERNDSSDNQQGENRRLSVDEINKEGFCNTEPSVMKDSIKTEAEETSDSGQEFSKSSAGENNPMNVEDFSALVKSEPVAEPVCGRESRASEDQSDDVPLGVQEDVTNLNENSTREKSSGEGSNYENNIDREKLDRLIEFLEGGVTTEGNDIPTDMAKSGKRKREDDSLSHSRRKLNKSSIVKNKNQAREMISLVSCKPSRKELKCTTNTISVAEPMCNENSDGGNIPKNKEDEESKDESDGGESLVVKEGNEKAESEMKDRKKLSPRRSSTKENFEEKKKKRKPKENGERLESVKEVDISKDSEEADIINTMRAFQKLQYHYCMSCDLNSSNDSFWINVVSGELRCLNCFKKMAVRSTKTALKSKNVLENSLHELKLPDTIYESLGESQGEEKKKENKNDLSDKGEINSNDKETTTTISTKEIKQILENVESKRTKKKRIRRKKGKDGGNECDPLAGYEAFLSGDSKRRKKTELPCFDLWNPWKSNSNLTESLNKNETKTKKEKSIKKDGSERSGLDKESFHQKCRENWSPWKSSLSLRELLNKNETKSKKEKSLKSEEADRSGAEKETVFVVEKLAKQMERKLKEKKKFKSTKQKENPVPATGENCGKAKTNLGGKKKCAGDDTPGRRKEKNEVPKVPKGQSDLMEKLYEKTKKLSWTLLGES